MHDWYSQIVKTVPDFDLGRCHWLWRMEVWDSEEGRCARLVLDYDGRFDIALVARGVREMPVIVTAATPGVLPYVPYDLGEFLISEQPDSGGVILFDELKGWRLVADSLWLEGVVPKDGAREESAGTT